MEKELTQTFVSQVASLEHMLDDAIQTGYTNETTIREKMNMFYELKRFVDKYCNEIVRNIFAEPGRINPAVFKQIALFTVLRFVVVGYLFNALRKRREDEVFAHLEAMRQALLSTLSHHRSGGRLD